MMGWTPCALCRHHSARADDSYGMGVSVLNGRSPSMNATTAAIDLAKNVFQVALADSNGRVRATSPHLCTVRALLRQSLRLAHDHGGMRLGAPLGARVRRARH